MLLVLLISYLIIKNLLSFWWPWQPLPLSTGYSMGGEAYWAAGLHLFTPLPFVRNELVRQIRIHSFATAGNLIQCSESIYNLNKNTPQF